MERTRLERRALERIRRAKHPLRGWPDVLVIIAQALVGLVLLFAVINLALSLLTFRGEDPVARTVQELRVLWFSPPDGQRMAANAFASVHGGALGANPSAAAIRTHIADQARDGVFLLDHVLIDRMLDLNGRLDAAVMPPGVYIGAHALGPDNPPWVHLTKYPAHYLLFPRHAYVLVVPVSGQAISFSASQNAKFGADQNPDSLAARLQAYGPGAYDFPGSGQALHEMTRVTDDPARIASALVRLRAVQSELERDRIRYNVLAPNSNTVIGCLLEDADVFTRAQRSDVLLALRAPGFGAACP